MQINVSNKESLRFACNRPQGFTNVNGGFPLKGQNMNQGSYLSNSLFQFNSIKRNGFIKKKINNTNPMDKYAGSSSQITEKRRILAIGKNINRLGLSKNQSSGFTNSDSSFVKTKKQRTRSGGCVAPAKKGASPISTICRVPANKGNKLP